MKEHGRQGHASLRFLLVGGASLLVLTVLVTLVALLQKSEAMRRSVDREARVLLAEQQTAARINHTVQQQLLDAADYLNDPRPATLERFRRRGETVYAELRGYLFRDLTLPERLQVEQVKELHQTLEVRAQRAFDTRRDDVAAYRAQWASLYAASEALQGGLDRFLALRVDDYQRSYVRQAAMLRQLFVLSAVLALVLLAAVGGTVRVLRNRILEPLHALGTTAHRLGTGDLSARVPVRYDDEMGRAAQSFNGMAVALDSLQDELRRSAARYRALVELSPDPLLVHGPREILLANAAATALLGAGDSPLVGRALTDFVQGDGGADADTSRLGALLARREAGERLELTLRAADGRAVLGEVAAAPVEFEGRPASIVVVRDLTARRDAEARLRETELHLRQAQKMDAIGRLAGGVAHDFNNLLTVILSYGEMLRVDVAEPEAREGVEEILTAAERASALTRQLLVFSRRQVLTLGRVDLGEVIEEMSSMLRRLIVEEVTFVTEVGDGPLVVRADRGQIEQVVMNLAINARDAMSEGGTVTIRARRVTMAENALGEERIPAGTYVSLVVEDTGVGIAPEVQARMFEPFFTTKEAGKGTGLGLATVYGIVQQSAGHLRVRSARGEGTAIEVLLPPLDAPAVEVAARTSAHAPRTGDETILLVEDEPMVRALAARVLRAHGYTVLEAHDGTEGERLATEHAGTIDLLLTDVVMPGIGGRELADRLRARRPALLVLFSSGYTEDEVLRRGVALSTERFIPKPYAPQSLVDAVRDTIDSGNGA